MRLLAASLQPCDLGEFTAAPSILPGFVPAIRIDLVVVSEQQNDDIMAAIQASARTGQAGEDWILVSPHWARRSHSRRETEEAADRT
jgi:nitrogen regulatory protein PII